VLDGVGIWGGLAHSVRAVGRYGWPAVSMTAILAALIAMLSWTPLLLLVLLPAVLCIGYAAYRDVFDPVGPARW
ncbi:MAG: hypothetical protein M3Q40_05225, partial [Pseudomonadota bacterium]|nr:hypothetical protein [Pseudomonadota bacterium]